MAENMNMDGYFAFQSDMKPPFFDDHSVSFIPTMFPLSLSSLSLTDPSIVAQELPLLDIDSKFRRSENITGDELSARYLASMDSGLSIMSDLHHPWGPVPRILRPVSNLSQTPSFHFKPMYTIQLPLAFLSKIHQREAIFASYLDVFGTVIPKTSLLVSLVKKHNDHYFQTGIPLSNRGFGIDLEQNLFQAEGSENPPPHFEIQWNSFVVSKIRKMFRNESPVILSLFTSLFQWILSDSLYPKDDSKVKKFPVPQSIVDFPNLPRLFLALSAPLVENPAIIPKMCMLDIDDFVSFIWKLTLAFYICLERYFSGNIFSIILDLFSQIVEIIEFKINMKLSFEERDDTWIGYSSSSFKALVPFPCWFISPNHFFIGKNKRNLPPSKIRLPPNGYHVFHPLDYLRGCLGFLSLRKITKDRILQLTPDLSTWSLSRFSSKRTNILPIYFPTSFKLPLISPLLPKFMLTSCFDFAITPFSQRMKSQDLISNYLSSFSSFALSSELNLPGINSSSISEHSSSSPPRKRKKSNFSNNNSPSLSESAAYDTSDSPNPNLYSISEVQRSQPTSSSHYFLPIPRNNYFSLLLSHGEPPEWKCFRIRQWIASLAATRFNSIKPSAIDSLVFGIQNLLSQISFEIDIGIKSYGLDPIRCSEVLNPHISQIYLPIPWFYTLNLLPFPQKKLIPSIIITILQKILPEIDQISKDPILANTSQTQLLALTLMEISSIFETGSIPANFFSKSHIDLSSDGIPHPPIRIPYKILDNIRSYNHLWERIPLFLSWFNATYPTFRLVKQHNWELLANFQHVSHFASSLNPVHQVSLSDVDVPNILYLAKCSLMYWLKRHYTLLFNRYS